MVIKKKKGTFNDYDVTVSWGQLNAIYRALEKDHSDALADEFFAELGWYLENVPGPGEDEEEYKEAKEAEKEAAGQGTEVGAPIPGEEEGEGDRDLSAVGQEIQAGEEPEGTEPPVEGQGEPGWEKDEQPKAGKPTEADRYLERPPARANPRQQRPTQLQREMA
jgi:hypothetical protein